VLPNGVGVDLSSPKLKLRSQEIKMRNLAAALVLIAVATGPAFGNDSSPAQDSRDKQRRAEELAIEATRQFMQAIEMMIQALPQYGMPRIDDQGNIIIPRLPNAQPPRAQPKEKPLPPSEDRDEDESQPDKSDGTRL
jgi:hypothetical protein